MAQNDIYNSNTKVNTRKIPLIPKNVDEIVIDARRNPVDAVIRTHHSGHCRVRTESVPDDAAFELR